MNKYEKIPEYIVDLHGYTTREAGEVLDGFAEESCSLLTYPCLG